MSANKNEWNSFQDRENQDPEKRKSFGRKKIWKKGKVSEGRCRILGKSEQIWKTLGNFDIIWKSQNRPGKFWENLQNLGKIGKI